MWRVRSVSDTLETIVWQEACRGKNGTCQRHFLSKAVDEPLVSVPLSSPLLKPLLTISFLPLLGLVVLAAFTSHCGHAWLCCIASSGHGGGGHGHGKGSHSVLQFVFLTELCDWQSVPWFGCVRIGGVNCISPNLSSAHSSHTWGRNSCLSSHIAGQISLFPLLGRPLRLQRRGRGVAPGRPGSWQKTLENEVEKQVFLQVPPLPAWFVWGRLLLR